MPLTGAECCRQVLCVRLFSTSAAASSANRFPFPSHASPTPHQIFHLPSGASQQAIKERYYDLVKIHHPDSPSNNPHLSHAQRHARFRAITAAYDSLRRGRHHGHHFSGTRSDEMDAIRAEIERRRRMYQHQHNKHAEYVNAGRFDWNSNPDDRWKDQLILGFGVIALAVGIAPNIFLYPFKMEQKHREAVRNLAQAKAEAEEHAEMRRRIIKNSAASLKSADGEQNKK